MSASENTDAFDLDLALEGVAIGGDNEEIENLIKCLGEQIEEAKENISKEWQQFAEESQQPVDTNVTAIKDITQIFQEKIKQEKQTCTTEPISLNVFLNNVVQALERNPELEMKILDDLVEFSTEQCLILPAPQPEAKDDVTSSSASLNVVVCKNEENTSALWEKICKTISRALLLYIDKLTLTQNNEQASEVFMKRVSLLEKMLILYLPSDVWKKHCRLRKQQIERFLQKPALLDDFEQSGMEYCNVEDGARSEASALVKVSHAITTMLKEDYKLLELGMFPDVFQIENDEIFDIYLSSFAEEFREVLKSLHSMSRRGSGNATNDNSGVILSEEIFTSLRLCLSAAVLVDETAKRLLHSLDFSCSKPTEILTMENPYGSTLSIPTAGSPMEAPNGDKEPSTLVSDVPDGVSNEIIWSWQEDFKPLVSKIALAIVEHMQYFVQAALVEEMKCYMEFTNYERVELSAQHVDDTFDLPKQVAKSCDTIITKIDNLLPFLLLRPGKEFEPIRSSFIEALSTALMSYHSRLHKISSNVPKSAPITNLYLTFASADFIQHKLKQYEEEYGEITSSLLGPYSDLVDSLSEKILSYHYVTIATVILQDVTSHHWMNQKEFFEGERCSFSIQMWNFYMQGLQHDLWQMCAPVKARTIFTSILQYSLSCLVKRYSKVIPTYHRTKLLRFDITSLLFSVSSWLIFTVSTSVTDILNPDLTRDAINDIHNSCSVLLAIVTIITCPLETLCLFTAGGGEELVSEGNATCTSWLSWLQPQLFGEHIMNLSSLSDIQAVHVYFKLTMFQPQPNWDLVLQTLLLRNAYLAVTIVSYLDSHWIQLHPEEDSCAKKTRVQFRDECSVSADDKDFCQSIVGSLYYVIHKCCKHSKPLVNFIVALINRENSWQIFTSVEGLRLGDEDKAPVWWECLYNTLKTFLDRLTQLAVSELCENKRTTTSFKFTAISSLPCGCEVTKETSSVKQKDKVELVFAAFERVLKSLVSAVPFLPRILFNVFNRIEGDLQQLKLSSDGALCAGVKILGSMVFRSLTAVDTTCIPEELNCTEDITKHCTQLAQLLYHVLAGQLEGFYENANLPIALETMVLSKKAWIREQVKKINEIITQSEWKESKQDSSEDNFTELQDSLHVKELFLDPKGEKTLKQIYHFCRAKKDWILRRIPIGSHLGSLQQIPPKPHVGIFDPLRAYRSLGGYPFDHAAVENFPFDWEQMFQSNIGMTLKSVKRLVYNRYELQNEKDVDEDKIEVVEKLKVFYDRESDAV